MSVCHQSIGKCARINWNHSKSRNPWKPTKIVWFNFLLFKARKAKIEKWRQPSRHFIMLGHRKQKKYFIARQVKLKRRTTFFLNCRMVPGKNSKVPTSVPMLGGKGFLPIRSFLCGKLPIQPRLDIARHHAQTTSTKPALQALWRTACRVGGLTESELLAPQLHLSGLWFPHGHGKPAKSSAVRVHHLWSRRGAFRGPQW